MIATPPRHAVRIAELGPVTVPEAESSRLVDRAPAHGDVLCYTGRRCLARVLAQSAADTERREVYVLEGYRPSDRGFLSPCYYVSRHPTPTIAVDGLPSPESVGPPFSVPLLVDVVLPRSADQSTTSGGFGILVEVEALR